MWKWSSCRQSSIPTARSFSTADTISAVVSPNLERSPVDSTHLPAPLVVSRARTPITGRRSSSAAAARMVSSSPTAVHRDDDAPAQLLGEERRLDEGAVLVPVAEDERLGVLLEGEGDEQLRLGARLDPQVVGPAVLHQLLDDVALLVDLDRVDPAEGALVVVLRDRLLEGAEELLDARAQDVGEADEDRQVEPAAAEVVHELLEVDAERPRPGGRDLDVAGLVDGEEVPTPPVDVVQLDGVLDRPRPQLSLQLASPPPALFSVRSS